jgi:thiosulfate/3-mercaptopyruvate sulfurtransferase
MAKSKVSFLMKFFLLSCLLVLGACQTRPTKMYETQEVRSRQQALAELYKGELVIDARPAFDFNLSKINGSIHLRWDEFTQKDEDMRGVFEKDLFFHARRLARLGISPETPITVVGRGLQGNGEEGRLAWTLKYFGVRNVRFIHIDAFDRSQLRSSAPERQPVPIWRPELDQSLIISRKDFIQKTMSKRDPVSNLIVMDVRPSAEYLGKTPSVLRMRPPDIGAINIPWTEFVTSYGLANEGIVEKLKSVMITPEKEILVISNFGVESAAVVMVLRELGFQNSRNLAGGYSELIFEVNQKRK